MLDFWRYTAYDILHLNLMNPVSKIYVSFLASFENFKKALILFYTTCCRTENNKHNCCQLNITCRNLEKAECWWHQWTHNSISYLLPRTGRFIYYLQSDERSFWRQQNTSDFDGPNEWYNIWCRYSSWKHLSIWTCWKHSQPQNIR